MKIGNKGIVRAIILSLLGTGWIIGCAGFAYYHIDLILRRAGEFAAKIVQHELFIPAAVAVAVAWGALALTIQLKDLQN